MKTLIMTVAIAETTLAMMVYSYIFTGQPLFLLRAMF